jgi:hypothetical protein
VAGPIAAGIILLTFTCVTILDAFVRRNNET